MHDITAINMRVLHDEHRVREMRDAAAAHRRQLGKIGRSDRPGRYRWRGR